MATELGTAYVSIVAETSKLEAQIKQALDGGGKHADLVGKDIGKRISASASKAMKDGWRPDQDIMAGIPDTKLDHIGARMGQVIGKGLVLGLRAKEAGTQFGNAFGEGAGSVGLGRVVAGWHRELSGGGAMRTIGMVAGKTLSAGLTAGVGLGVAGIGLALTSGFDRLEKLDSAKSKLNNLNKAAALFNKPLIDVKKTVDDVTQSVTGTPYSLDAAFGIAVNAIGSGAKDIGSYMAAVTDATAFAGGSIEDIGGVFQDMLNQGNVSLEGLNRLDARFPATSWVKESVEKTGGDFKKMLADGQITMDMLQKSIEEHAPGLAKSAGDTLSGSIELMKTAVARTGADFLAALFGGPTGDPAEGLKSAIQRVTEMLNNLDNWVKAHKDQIKKFFEDAKDAASKLVEVVGKILEAINNIPGGITTVVGAFVAWKAISGVAGLISSLGTISKFLGVTLGADAAIGGAAIAAGLSKALPIIAQIYAAYELGKSNPVFAPPGTKGPDGTSYNIGPDGKVTIYDANGQPYGGMPASEPGSNGRREKPGHSVLSDPTGGLLGQTLPQKNITPTVDTAPATSAIDALKATMTEPVVIPADSDTAPAASTTGKWRTDESGNAVFIPVDANVDSANATMAAFLDKWSSAIISPQVVVPGQVTAGAGGKPPSLSNLLGFPGGKATGGSITGPGSGTSDSIPALLSNGEHVLTAKDVSAMGGQSGVYSFRKALHAATGGAVKDDKRTAGAMPAAAGSTNKAGTSAIAGAIDMGGEIINGIIDQAASAVATAASAAATAGSAGAAGPEGGMAAGAASQFAIGLASNTAKRGVKYGFDLLGIGADSLLEQLTPFGQPRWLNQDYTGFVPQQQITGALGDLMTGGAKKAAGTVDPNTTEHGTGAGAQPGPNSGGPLENLGQSIFDGFSKAIPSGAVEPVAPTPMVSDANSFLSTQLAAPEAPAPNQPPMFKVDNIYTQDVDSLGRELNKQGRLAQMQYTNRPGP